ncbi:MAG: hypothetical protein KGM24_00495 [Elusimicrobia bacterium]|nr:hypothetical protein [Elusimicrobiota bacterium]
MSAGAAVRVRKNPRGRLLAAAGAALLLLIPASARLLPPSSSVLSSAAAARGFGVLGGALLLIGVLKLSAALELEGTLLRCRRFLRTRTLDLREATHVLESTARVAVLYGGTAVVRCLHFCRAREPGAGASFLGRVREEGAAAGVRAFRAAAAEGGVDVLLTVYGYVGERPEDSPFRREDVVRLLSAARRACPALEFAPAVLRRLGLPEGG